MAKAPKAEIVTGIALSAHLDCARETISDYVAKGIIVKRADGKYDQTQCRHRVLKHLRDRNAGRTGGKLSEHRSELAAEQTLAIKFKNAVLRGDYVSAGVIQRAGEKMLEVFRERILSIPGKVADTLAGRTREEVDLILREELYEALDELSNPAAFGGSGGERNVSGDVPRSSAAS